MTANNQTRAVVSAILYKEEAGQKKIFLQTRWKPNTSPMYSGMLEIPAGGIDAYENVYDTILDPNEAKDPRWVTIEELSEIINKNPETIFPLQLPVLQYFISMFLS